MKPTESQASQPEAVESIPPGAAGSSPISSFKALRDWVAAAPQQALGLGVALALLLLFYMILPLYGPTTNYSVMGWMENAWNKETNYEHGYLVPILMLGMIAAVWKDLAKVRVEPDWRGIIIIFFGALLFAAAYRTGQARVAVSSFPFVVVGAIWYIWGFQVVKWVFYPVFFLLVALPLPGFQQSTVPLQILATQGAQWLSSIAGVETITLGTEISPVSGKWEPLEVAGGCSGIRSLMALIMISAAWAFLARELSLWKRAILLFAAVPLAILGNMLRVGSICIMAEYVNYEFAAGTWHDWSGLLLFYPISLALLFITHSVLRGELAFVNRKKRKVVVTRKSP